MKVEIDTINKTIKILDISTLEEVFDTMVEIPNFKEYKFIPNTIINTIKIRDEKPLEWVQPYNNPWNPYKVTCSNGVTLSNNTIS